MTHPVYSQQYLSTLEPAQLKVIAKQLGIEKPAFRKVALIPQILKHQAAALKPATPAPRTCKNCPFFQSHGNTGKGLDKGWCTQFDRAARETHEETQDCINQGGEVEGVAPINTEATEWEAAQSEVLATLEEQVREIAPEEVVTIEHDGNHTTTILNTGAIILSTPGSNVYMIPSASEAGVRYRVNLFRRTCTCTGFSYRRSCRHMEEAERQSAEDFEYWQQAAAKLPAGWREKQEVFTTAAGTKETQTWYYNSKGHRTNLMPV